MEQLVRYVPANPLRAGVCKTPTDLENYRWTGHAVLMGTREAAFQDTWPVLRRFGRTVADGRRGNAEFVAEAVNQSSERLSVLRKGNTDRDRWTPGLYVIGDPECRGARLRHTSTRSVRRSTSRRISERHCPQGPIICHVFPSPIPITTPTPSYSGQTAVVLQLPGNVHQRQFAAGEIIAQGITRQSPRVLTI